MIHMVDRRLMMPIRLNEGPLQKEGQSGCRLGCRSMFRPQ